MTSIIHYKLNKNLSQWKSLQKLLILMKVTKFQKISVSKIEHFCVSKFKVIIIKFAVKNQSLEAKKEYNLKAVCFSDKILIGKVEKYQIRYVNI